MGEVPAAPAPLGEGRGSLLEWTRGLGVGEVLAAPGRPALQS